MKTKNRITLIIIVGLLAILAVLSSRIVFANANLQYAQYSTSTPVSRALLKIQLLEHDLQFGNIDDNTRRGLRAMITETWLEATREVKFRITTPQTFPKFTDIPIPTSKDLNYGISTPDSSFPYLPYTINNMWRGLDNGVYLAILGGCLKSEPEQGILSYKTLTSSPMEVRTEKKSGCLTIMEDIDNGKKLVVQAKNGDTYYFDIPGRIFVQSLDGVAPTITPQPTDVTPSPATPEPPYPVPNSSNQLKAYPNP